MFINTTDHNIAKAQHNVAKPVFIGSGWAQLRSKRELITLYKT